jgi:hypothetical protein
MSEEKTTGQEEQAQRPSSEAWADVGRQFAKLGESIAAVCRSAWEDEGNQQVLKEMRAGLESMAHAMAKAVDDAAASPEGQKFREDAEKAAASAREIGEHTVEEVRPQLVSALHQVNEGLKEMIDRMKKKTSAAESAPASPDESEL